MEASGASPPGQGQQRTSRRLLDVSKADYTSGSLVHLPGMDKPLQQRPRPEPSRTKSLEVQEPEQVTGRTRMPSVMERYTSTKMF